MGAVLGSLGRRGYGYAWRVVDSQFFGVPQRRRRVVIVGRLGDGAGPVEVLLEPEGGGGDSAPRLEEGPGAAGAAAGGSGVFSASMTGVGWWNADDGVTGTLASREYKDTAHVVVALEGADASEDGTGQGTPIIGFSHTAGIDHQADESTFPPPMAGHDRMPAVATSSAVRRLTPVECERLQGFPDGWTAQRVERSGRRAGQVADQFDSARYRQMGNAVTVDVFAWVMRRLAAVDAGDAS